MSRTVQIDTVKYRTNYWTTKFALVESQVTRSVHGFYFQSMNRKKGVFLLLFCGKSLYGWLEEEEDGVNG